MVVCEYSRENTNIVKRLVYIVLIHVPVLQSLPNQLIELYGHQNVKLNHIKILRLSAACTTEKAFKGAFVWMCICGYTTWSQFVD